MKNKNNLTVIKNCVLCFYYVLWLILHTDIIGAIIHFLNLLLYFFIHIMKKKNLIKQLCEQLIFLLVDTADVC